MAEVGKHEAAKTLYTEISEPKPMQRGARTLRSRDEPVGVTEAVYGRTLGGMHATGDAS